MFGSLLLLFLVEILLVEKLILRSDLLVYLWLMYYYYGCEKSIVVKKFILKLFKILKNIIENFYVYEIFYIL